MTDVNKDECSVCGTEPDEDQVKVGATLKQWICKKCQRINIRKVK